MATDDETENSLTQLGEGEGGNAENSGTSYGNAAGTPDDAPFLEHLEEFRAALIWCIVVFAAVGAVSLIFSKEIFGFLRWPLEHASGVPAALGEQALVIMRFMDVFSILLYIALSGAIVFAGPPILYRLARFVAPAFSPAERSRLAPLCVASSVLFLLGAALAFFLFAPISIAIPYRLAAYFGMQMNWLAEDYYLFVVALTLFSGLMFELPLFVIFLITTGISDRRALLAKWRWVLAGILVAVVLLSPVGDPIALIAFSAVLFALYLGGIFVGDFLSKKFAARAA